MCYRIRSIADVVATQTRFLQSPGIHDADGLELVKAQQAIDVLRNTWVTGGGTFPDPAEYGEALNDGGDGVIQVPPYYCCKLQIIPHDANETDVIATTVANDPAGRIWVDSHYVTGPGFSPELLALILYTEYDHIVRGADPTITHEDMQTDLWNLAVTNGVVTQYRQFHHGAPEGRSEP